MKKCLLLAAFIAAAAPTTQTVAGFSSALQQRDWRVPFRVIDNIAKQQLTTRILVYGGATLYLARLMKYNDLNKFLDLVPFNFGKKIRPYIYNVKKTYLGSPFEKAILQPLVIQNEKSRAEDTTNALTSIQKHNTAVDAALAKQFNNNQLDNNDKALVQQGLWALSYQDDDQSPLYPTKDFNWVKILKLLGLKINATELFSSVVLAPLFVFYLKQDLNTAKNAFTSCWSFLTHK